MKRYIVTCGVKGAHRLTSREFDSFTEAEAHAARWQSSNSQGSYFARISEIDEPSVPAPGEYGFEESDSYKDSDESWTATP